MDVKLREFELSDLETLVSNGNNKNISSRVKKCFCPEEFTKEFGAFFIQICRNKAKNLWFAIAIDNIAVGFIGLSIKVVGCTKFAELGFWLGQDYWNKGATTIAIKDILKIAFDEHDIDRIYSELYVPNNPAEKVLIKNGFELAKTIKCSTKYTDPKYALSKIYIIDNEAKINL